MNEQEYLEGRNIHFADGGYPRFMVMNDGACLCMKCAKAEGAQILQDMAWRQDTGWRPAAWDVNWEDPELYCDHCSERIESAYAEE